VTYPRRVEYTHCPNNNKEDEYYPEVLTRAYEESSMTTGHKKDRAKVDNATN
jgi:hypothetical protein